MPTAPTISKYDYLKKIERKERTTGVKKALAAIRERQGVSDEQMAVDLEVTAPTIWSWKSGRRCPKFATIKLIESRYKVKIL